MNRYNFNRYTLMGFIAILLWSTTVALARSISEQIGPLTAGAAVYITGGIILFVKFLFNNRRTKDKQNFRYKYLFICGILFMTYTIALFIALGMAKNRQQTIEVGLINYLWPALTILFSLFLISRKANFWLLPGTMTAFFGVVLVLTQGSAISLNLFLKHLLDNPTVYGLGFLAAVVWALYSNLTHRWRQTFHTGAVSFFILSTGLVMLLVCLLNPEKSSWTIRVAIEIVFLALATATAYSFWDISIRKGNVILVVSSSYLTPFLSTLVACIYLGVFPGIRLWLGCLLIIGGSFISYCSVSEQ